MLIENVEFQIPVFSKGILEPIITEITKRSDNQMFEAIGNVLQVTDDISEVNMPIIVQSYGLMRWNYKKIDIQSYETFSLQKLDIVIGTTSIIKLPFGHLTYSSMLDLDSELFQKTINNIPLGFLDKANLLDDYLKCKYSKSLNVDIVKKALKYLFAIKTEPIKLESLFNLDLMDTSLEITKYHIQENIHLITEPKRKEAETLELLQSLAIRGEDLAHNSSLQLPDIEGVNILEIPTELYQTKFEYNTILTIFSRLDIKDRPIKSGIFTHGKFKDAPLKEVMEFFYTVTQDQSEAELNKLYKSFGKKESLDQELKSLELAEVKDAKSQDIKVIDSFSGFNFGLPKVKKNDDNILDFKEEEEKEEKSFDLEKEEEKTVQQSQDPFASGGFSFFSAIKKDKEKETSKKKSSCYR